MSATKNRDRKDRIKQKNKEGMRKEKKTKRREKKVRKMERKGESERTRPDTRQDSRGRFGRGSNAKTARNLEM